LDCDICGRSISAQAYKVEVEGAKMLVCGHCQNLGKPYKEEPKTVCMPPQIPLIQDPIKRGISFIPTRKRTAELPKEMDQLDVADDFAERVRRYRSKLGLSQEELAKRVKEKLSVIQKVETGKISPNSRLCRALEHELKVKLLIPHAEIEDVPKGIAPTEVTLGDIVRVKGKTKSEQS
jgi:putative transcription factor